MGRADYTPVRLEENQTQEIESLKSPFLIGGYETLGAKAAPQTNSKIDSKTDATIDPKIHSKTDPTIDSKIDSETDSTADLKSVPKCA